MSEERKDKYAHCTVLVWECSFNLMDEDDNEVCNEDGSVKIFTAPDLDWSHIAEYVELKDLVEVSKDE